MGTRVADKPETDSVPYGDVNDAGRRKIADRIDIGELRKHAGRTGAIPHMHELAVPGND